MTDAIAIPGYSIVRQLGRGGMAAVYLAIQRSFERDVALKVMSPLLNSDPSFTTRFTREARIVAHIHHASIVPVFDVGEHQPYHYLSMEFLPGGDLKQRIAQGNHNEALAIGVCMSVSSALDLAHRKGFVHRDIKPENILFREDGTPVLTDFGIARAIDSGTSLTVAGMFVGTPSYMSPEQVKGLELDGRSDLYSLGIVFYEILTGVVPFRADSTLSVALKHLTEPLPQLPHEYAHYQSFLDRLTAKDRDKRFSTGLEVMQALREIGDLQVEPDRTLVRSRHSIGLDAYALTMPPHQARLRKTSGLHRRWWSSTNAGAAGIARSIARIPALLQLDRWLPWLNEAAGSPLRMVQRIQLPAFDGRWLPMAGAAVIAICVIAGAGFLLFVRNGTNRPAELTSVPVPIQSPATTSDPIAAGTDALDTAPLVDSEMPIEAATEESEGAADSAESQEASEKDAAFKARVAELAERNKQRARQQEEQRRQREEQAVAQEAQISELLAKARSEYAQGFWLEPAGANAAESYAAILKLQPQHGEALAGVQRIGDILVAEAARAESAGDVKSAQRLVGQIRALRPDHPKLVVLQAGLERIESQPIELTRRQRADLDRAARAVAKAYEYLERKPMNLRMTEAATEQYDRAAEATSLAPGLPYLKERIVAAYVIAVQTELEDKQAKRALKVLSNARERNWLTPELAQLENRIKAAAQP